ncbi:MAG: two-component sensor histidine kinase, partial [Lachnospiraceae bacterium]|nr:two-component sensor histidine kinase [Lachnospiraceae bacterium]
FYCEVIVDEAGKMNNMVKKLLTLNQLEFGNSQVNMDHFDVVELVNNYIASARLLAKQQGIRLSVQKSGPIKVWADEFLVEEVFQNYYSNALHHVEGDKVIDIRFEQKEKCVRISVFNTGKPIPAEALPHLWEKFYKVDKARTREYGGSGVGLSIVRAIMNLLHQQYGVVNYNDGVMFWFELDTGISKPEIEEGDFLDQSGEDDIMDGEYIQL